MQKLSLTALARQQLKLARQAPSGRSAQTVYGGHERTLRQTLIALTTGNALKVQDGPGQATVLVLSGRVRLVAGKASWNGSPGDLLIVPDAKHTIEAVEDSAIVLTVAITVVVR
jgi:quercetin dioxygenase-like cupin family protein